LKCGRELNSFNNLFDGDKEPETTFKQCSKCNEILESDNFSWGINFGIRKQRHECKKCEKHLQTVRARLRKQHVRPAKDFCCPICLKNEQELQGIGGKNRSVWCVDHDHDTDEFKGWLCHKCNRTLGGFYDDIDMLKRAVVYVERVNRKSKMRNKNV